MSDRPGSKKRFKLDGFTVILGIIVIALVLFLPLQSLSDNDDVAVVVEEDIANEVPDERQLLETGEEQVESPDGASSATASVYYDEYNPYAMQVRIEAALERLEATRQSLNNLEVILQDLHERAVEQTEYFNAQVEGESEPEE